MTAYHHITRAQTVFRGPAVFQPARASHGNESNSAKGAEWKHEYVQEVGAAVAADADRILNDADATDSVQTHTSFLAQPDVPRNLTATGTAGSNHVVTVTGTDKYGVTIVEDLTLSGTSVIAGKKAFLTVTNVSVAVGAASDTFDLGIGDVFGLDHAIANKGKFLGCFVDGVAETATITAAVTTDPATSTTGDVRGTVDPNTAADGSAYITFRYLLDTSTKPLLFGVDQYGG